MSDNPLPKHIEIKSLRGRDALDLIESIGKLRISVFKDFPYLYDGDLDYERKYLGRYFSAHNSVIVLVYDNRRESADQIVGASTGIALSDEEDTFKKPFIDNGYKIAEIFYFGESVLLSDYRGLGIGKEFFKHRERFAQSLPEIKMATFCGVIRPVNHSLRPPDYRPLDSFWKSMGFNLLDGMKVSLRWKDIDQSQETSKDLQFWAKNF